jgi:hypothetical protein
MANARAVIGDPRGPVGYETIVFPGTSKSVTQSLTRVSVALIFELHNLDGRIWVRPYVGNEEYNGETFASVPEAVDALPMLARELGWTDYRTTFT